MNFIRQKLIAIGLSPNSFPEDVKLAAKLLLQPWKWQQREVVPTCKQELLFDSGRSALFTLLQVFGIGQDNEVLIQAFTCVAVPNSVLWVGAKPIYVDIDLSTLNMDLDDLQRKITPRSRAIIVQHTFGLPAPMDKILQIAKAYRLIVIEDCAHALGAEYKDQKIGTMGEAAFFSFGRDKTISSVAGGRAVIGQNLKAENERLQAVYQKLNYPSNRWVFQQLLHPLLSELILGTYHIGFGKALHYFLLKTEIISKANTKGEKRWAQRPARIPSKMPRALQLLMQNQLVGLNAFNQKRRKIVRAYLQAGLKSIQPDVPGRVWLRFPILVNDPASLHLLAKEQGIILGDWYDQVIGPKEVDLKRIGYKKGSCPTAEKVAKNIVNLPTYPKMDEKDITRVIKVASKLKLIKSSGAFWA